MLRRVIRHSLQLALLGFLAWYLYINWGDYRHVFQQARPLWKPLIASCFLVGVAYVTLIQTWRQVVVAWGERLDFQSASRIWFVANLGKYLPGKYWSIAAMGALAKEQGISSVAAVGSSLVVQLVNLVTGFAIVLVTGGKALDVPAVALVGVVGLAVALIAAPTALPLVVTLVNRVTGRAMPVPHLPRRALWWAVAGTTVAWLFYGAAFELFAVGMSAGAVGGSLGDWTAIFVGPYLVGFIAFFAPGGIGAREVAMAEALQRTGLAIGSLQALLVASSRVWLTVLEIIPGVIFLLLKPLKRTATSSH